MVHEVSPDQEMIEQWKQQYGEVYKLSGENDAGEVLEFYFRKPGRADISRLAKEALNNTLNAMSNLVYGCLLFPNPEVMHKILDDKPGLIPSLGAELQKIVGSTQNFLSTRL